MLSIASVLRSGLYKRPDYRTGGCLMVFVHLFYLLSSSWRPFVSACTRYLAPYDDYCYWRSYYGITFHILWACGDNSYPALDQINCVRKLYRITTAVYPCSIALAIEIRNSHGRFAASDRYPGSSMSSSQAETSATPCGSHVDINSQKTLSLGTRDIQHH